MTLRLCALTVLLLISMCEAISMFDLPCTRPRKTSNSFSLSREMEASDRQARIVRCVGQHVLAEVALALHHERGGGDHFVEGAALVHESIAAHPQYADAVGGLVGGTTPRGWAGVDRCGPQPADHFDAAEHRDVQIEDHKCGLHSRTPRARAFPVPRSATTWNPAGAFEQGAQRGPDHRMVIDDDARLNMRAAPCHRNAAASRCRRRSVPRPRVSLLQPVGLSSAA